MKKTSKPLLFATVTLSLFLSFFVKNLLAAPVSIESPQQVALNWMGEKTHRTYEMNEVSEVYAKKLKNEQVYFVFNVGEKGWVIVAADDVVYPIICYSREGSYSEKNHPPAFDEWMNNVSKDIYAAITAGLPRFRKQPRLGADLTRPKKTSVRILHIPGRLWNRYWKPHGARENSTMNHARQMQAVLLMPVDMLWQGVLRLQWHRL